MSVTQWIDEAEGDLHGKYIHITNQEVEEAALLAQKGVQRLQTVSNCESTLFYFFTSRNGHFGAAEICVTPMSRDERNPFYRPTLRYTLCCDDAPLDYFKRQHQTVYDVRIRPSQWTFGDDRYGDNPFAAVAS